MLHYVLNRLWRHILNGLCVVHGRNRGCCRCIHNNSGVSISDACPFPFEALANLIARVRRLLIQSFLRSRGANRRRRKQNRMGRQTTAVADWYRIVSLSALYHIAWRSNCSGRNHEPSAVGYKCKTSSSNHRIGGKRLHPLGWRCCRCGRWCHRSRGRKCGGEP